MLFYTEGMIIGFEDYMDKVKYLPLSFNETMQFFARFVKRHVFYNKPITFGQSDVNDGTIHIKELITVYLNLKAWIQFEASQLGLTIVDVQNHNTEKINKSYPNYEYSDTRENERAENKRKGNFPIQGIAPSVCCKLVYVRSVLSLLRCISHLDVREPSRPTFHLSSTSSRNSLLLSCLILRALKRAT